MCTANLSCGQTWHTHIHTLVASGMGVFPLLPFRKLNLNIAQQLQCDTISRASESELRLRNTQRKGATGDEVEDGERGGPSAAVHIFDWLPNKFANAQAAAVAGAEMLTQKTTTATTTASASCVRSKANATRAQAKAVKCWQGEGEIGAVAEKFYGAP